MLYFVVRTILNSLFLPIMCVIYIYEPPSAVGMTPFQFAVSTAEEKKGGEEDGLAQVSASLLV
jgi:hypothetical protein